MDLRAGNHSGTKGEVRHQRPECGMESEDPVAADGRGVNTNKIGGNQVSKGAGSSTYKVIAHISLHPIPHPPSTIESCGKWIETVRDGKSI